MLREVRTGLSQALLIKVRCGEPGAEEGGVVNADREGTVPLAPGLSSGDVHSSLGQQAAPSKGN